MSASQAGSTHQVEPLLYCPAAAVVDRARRRAWPVGISPRMFTMLVLMAIVSTVITTPLLRRWMRKSAGFSTAAIARAAFVPIGRKPT